MALKVDERTIKTKLKSYGLLNIKAIQYGENRIYVAYLLPLPLILQSMITIVVGEGTFKVSSGIVFDSRDVDEKVVSEAEKMMNRVTKGKEVALRENAGMFWIEVKEDDVTMLEGAIERIAGEIKELEQVFSQSECIREECLRKKYFYLYGLSCK